ncbi:MAG: head-tail adaptor protein [Gammaproteobacteria bacterium]
MPLNVGPLDTRITFITKVGQQEPEYGTVTGEPVDGPSAWANKEDVLPSREEGLHAGVLSTISQKVRLRFRWRDDINANMRVRIEGPLTRTMEIIGGPAEIGDRRTYMEIMCEEISTNE